MEEYPRVMYGHDSSGDPQCPAVDENGVLNVRLSAWEAGELNVAATSAASVSGWKTANIVVQEADNLSGAVDLGDHYRYMAVIVPALTSARVGIHVAMALDGTYVPLGSGTAAQTEPTTGGYATIFDTGGWRYVKLSTSAAQAIDREFTLQGVRG